MSLGRPGRGLRDVQRELRRHFKLSTAPEQTETREYFDTFDWRLFRGGLALSRMDDRLLLTDICSGEQVARAAWRRRNPPRFARDLPGDDMRRVVAPLADPRALLPVARVHVKARALALQGAGGASVATIRLDTASAGRPGSARRVSAVLADVADGDARATIRAALVRAGFRASERSWFEVLLREAGCRPADHAPRPDFAIDEETPARTALAAILLHLHGVMRRNEPGIRDDVDIEFLHDYRVALRRTRTALGELRGVFPAETEALFRERLRAIAPLTGRLRDLDVHLSRRDNYLDRLPESFRPGLQRVFDDMLASRHAALEELRVMLASREYATLMRDWKRAIGELARGTSVGIDAEAPAIGLARRAIRKRYGRLSEIASAPEALDPAALHRARLNGKKLRYVIEFFRSALGRKAAAALARIESAQDALGEYTDLGVQIRFFRRMLESVPGGTGNVQRAAALGAMIALLEARRRKVRRRCERRLRALRNPLPASLA